MALDYTPYSTAAPWMTGIPPWMGEDDGARIESYTLYEQMYWNVPETFKLSQLGSDEDPIYVPNPKIIVEAILRYLCVDWDIVADPLLGTEEQRSLAMTHIRKLMKREKFKSKFKTQLRYCMIRGDAMWHITADENKPAGARLSIHELDPATYFPITDVDDLDRITGVHIVDPIDETRPDGSKVSYLRRQTYRREVDEDDVFTGRITSALALFELTGWDDRDIEPKDLKLVRTLEDVHYLPEEITQIPVYHWKNIRNPADPFGSSQLRGLERIFAAINQTISDEDLAVALMGLGVFATDAGAPEDENGDPTSWMIGPGRVVEHAPGSKFERVDGITTVEPAQAHVAYLENKMKQGAGVPDVAIGEVDVQAAESGIALALRLSPLLAANAEKQLEILGTTDQMLYDLQTMWFPAYEGVDFGDALIESVVGDPMPQNRDSAIAEVVALATSNPPIITLEEARTRLTTLGYTMSDTTAAKIYEQLQTIASNTDPFGGRMRTEADDIDGEDDVSEEG